MNGFEGGGGVPGRRRYDDDEGHEKEMLRRVIEFLFAYFNKRLFYQCRNRKIKILCISGQIVPTSDVDITSLTALD